MRELLSIAEGDVAKKLNEIILIETANPSSKFNWYKYVGKAVTLPGIRGIYHKNGYKVATDSYILIAEFCEYDNELEGNILSKDGSFIDGRFPNWQAAIPSDEKRVGSVKIDFDRWTQIYKQYTADKKMGCQYSYTKVGNRLYEMELFQKFVAWMKHIGATELFENSDREGQIMATVVRNNNNVGLLMPRSWTDDDVKYYVW